MRAVGVVALGLLVGCATTEPVVPTPPPPAPPHEATEHTHDEAVGLEPHDHTALHGGQVNMWGDLHVEYAPQDGEHRFWVTGANRIPVTGPVTGTVKDGDKVLPLTLDPSGMLSAKAEGAGSRPVLVEITTEGQTFSLGFNPGGAGAMPPMEGMGGH